MAEFAAGDTGRQAVVADGDLLVHEGIGKIVGALGHGSDKDADALVLVERVDVVAHTHDALVKTQGDLTAVGGEVVGDGVLDDAEQLLLRVSRADREAVEQLHHQAGEALERAGDADRRRDLNEDAFGGLDVDLQPACLVDGRVKEGKEALDGCSKGQLYRSGSQERGGEEKVRGMGRPGA